MWVSNFKRFSDSLLLIRQGRVLKVVLQQLTLIDKGAFGPVIDKTCEFLRGISGNDSVLLFNQRTRSVDWNNGIKCFDSILVEDVHQPTHSG